MVTTSARVRAPGCQDSLPRPELTSRLEAAADTRLTTVVAPAGFGKTVALASWAQTEARQADRSTWLTLTGRIDSAERFASALADSLQAGLPDLRGVAEAAEEWEDRFEQLAARLVSIVAACDRTVVSIIDSFDTAPAAQDPTRCLVDLAPPNWRFVTASRRPPLDGIARLRAAGDLVEIGALELRFDTTEVHRMLAAAGLDPGSAADVAEVTGGWPQAVAEAVALLGAAEDVEAALTDLASGATPVDRAVTAEAVRVLSPAARAVLADAALLRHADSTAWAAVAGDAQGAAAYRDAVAAQLVVPIDDRWHRAHPPLRRISDGTLAIDSERRARVLGRAARWAAAAGLAEDAVTYAFAAGDDAYGTELMTDYSRTSTARGRPDRVLRLVDALDADLASRPVIVAERGWAAVLAGDLDQLAAVVADLDESGDAGVPPPLAAAVFRTTLQLLQGDARAALASAQAATAELDRRAPRLHHGAVDPGWAWAFHAAAAAMAGDFDNARDAASVVVEGGFLGQPLILGAGVYAVMELYRDARDRAAALARLSMSVADTELEADLPVCAPALFVLAHDQDPVHAARALSRLRRLRATAPSSYVDILVMLAETVQGARTGRVAQDTQDVAERARDVAGPDTDGAPGLERFIAGVERQIAAAAAMPAIDSRLSEAETSVLRLMGRELTRRQIGFELGISLNTVKFHARSVLRKLGATSTVEAVERGRRLGLLPEGPDH